MSSVMVGGQESEGIDIREVVVYVFWGGYLEECSNEMVAYEGGIKDCLS